MIKHLRQRLCLFGTLQIAIFAARCRAHGARRSSLRHKTCRALNAGLQRPKPGLMLNILNFTGHDATAWPFMQKTLAKGV
jgi:hypothetical protein